MLVTVALMILPPDLLSVIVAFRMAMPKSISLMFPMMLPRAFWGPPDKKTWCYDLPMHPVFIELYKVKSKSFKTGL